MLGMTVVVIAMLGLAGPPAHAYDCKTPDSIGRDVIVADSASFFTGVLMSINRTVNPSTDRVSFVAVYEVAAVWNGPDLPKRRQVPYTFNVWRRAQGRYALSREHRRQGHVQRLRCCRRTPTPTHRLTRSLPVRRRPSTFSRSVMLSPPSALGVVSMRGEWIEARLQPMPATSTDASCEECGSEIVSGPIPDVDLEFPGEVQLADWCTSLACPSNARPRGFNRIGIAIYRCQKCSRAFDASFAQLVEHRDTCA